MVPHREKKVGRAVTETEPDQATATQKMAVLVVVNMTAAVAVGSMATSQQLFTITSSKIYDHSPPTFCHILPPYAQFSYSHYTAKSF